MRNANLIDFGPLQGILAMDDACELARLLRSSRLTSELVIPNYLKPLKSKALVGINADPLYGKPVCNIDKQVRTISAKQRRALNRKIFRTACSIVRKHPKILWTYDSYRSGVFTRFCQSYGLEQGEALDVLAQADHRIRTVIPARIAAYAASVDLSAYSAREQAVYRALVRMSASDGPTVLVSLRTLAERAMIEAAPVQVKRALLKLERQGLIEIEWGKPKRRGYKPTATKVTLVYV